MGGWEHGGSAAGTKLNKLSVNFTSNGSLKLMHGGPAVALTSYSYLSEIKMCNFHLGFK